MKAEVIAQERWYEVRLPNGEYWTFENEDKDISYIDDAIEAWTAWREYVVADMMRGQL